jgi:hypothetical protein
MQDAAKRLTAAAGGETAPHKAAAEARQGLDAATKAAADARAKAEKLKGLVDPKPVQSDAIPAGDTIIV